MARSARARHAAVMPFSGTVESVDKGFFRGMVIKPIRKQSMDVARASETVLRSALLSVGAVTRRIAGSFRIGRLESA
jgi:hypothetical protein